MRRLTRVLVIGGLGPFYLEDDFYAQNLDKAFRKDGAFVVDVVDGAVRRGAQAATMLTNGDYQVCIVPSVGGGDVDPFRNTDFCGQITSWVRAGGVLFLNGERAAAATLARVFGKQSWQMMGDFYRRTVHELNRSSVFAPPELALPPRYNVKACMLSGVAPDERVYGAGSSSVTLSLVPMMAGESVNEGMCSLAAASFGEGVVVFFGDVNAETCTTDVIVALAKHLAG